MLSAHIYIFKLAYCGHCVKLMPIIESVKEKYTHKSNIHFHYIELDKIQQFVKSHPHIAKELQVEQIHMVPDIRIVISSPTKNIISSSKYTGNRTVEDIYKWIHSCMSSKNKSIHRGGRPRCTRKVNRKKHIGTRRRKYTNRKLYKPM